MNERKTDRELLFSGVTPMAWTRLWRTQLCLPRFRSLEQLVACL